MTEQKRVTEHWIIHDSHDSFFRSPFGAVPCHEKITLRLQVHFSHPLEEVIVNIHKDKSAGESENIEMHLESRNEADVYKVIIPAPDEAQLVWYYFRVKSEGREYFYGKKSHGYGGVGQVSPSTPPAYQITVFEKDSTTPNWFKESIMYQIFVDRFYNGHENGEILNPKKNSFIHSHWENEPLYIKNEQGEVIRWDFFGGNLVGIKKKLPYLKSLGIGVIYLNPIFEATSNHKYDTGDYHKVDAMFGDYTLFQELCQEAKKMGMVVIFDGVFSHTGSDSIYFNKEGHYPSLGAFQSKESPYYDWYIFHNHPHEYESWWGIGVLPNVNELNPSYQDFIIFDENSVLRHWMKAGIQGWRLDVADELPAEFIRKFRQTLKECDPDAILIGEVWEDASNKTSYGHRREYLLGRELDSVMNYPFRSILIEYMLGKIDAELVHQALMNLHENYPLHHFYSMMNLLSSHDVPRIVTELNQALPDQLTKEEGVNVSIQRLKLLVLWQMTFPGVPCIYYGDEAGLQGGSDPYNRATYPWGRENKELLHWYKEMTALRHHYDVFKTGEWISLHPHPEVYGYIRHVKDGTDVFQQEKANNAALILMNRSVDETISLSLEIGSWFTHSLYDFLADEEVELHNGTLHVTLTPLQGKVFMQDRWATNLVQDRGAGILLHPTSLPSKYGIGDVGQEAYRFIDFLEQSKQTYWQILPLNPVGYGGSPYQSYSAFAGNTLLIDLEQLLEEGWLDKEDLTETPEFSEQKVDYTKVEQYKEGLFRKAFNRFKQEKREEEFKEEYIQFLQKHQHWLNDYALFMSLKTHFDQRPWNEWPKPIARQEMKALSQYKILLTEEIEYHQFLQYIFFNQWRKLKTYANKKQIKIIGDLPIFVAHNSCDVWVHPHLFELDEKGYCSKVAGVPPDYFSPTGQRWGNSLYQWNEMKKDDYLWWRERISLISELVDVMRIDHFRGFEAYWEIPAEEETAVFGQWVKGPGEEFFQTIGNYVGNIPIIAEDLGYITPEVEDLKQSCGFPGMKVLQFMISADHPTFHLSLHQHDHILYTGTHDNETILAWHQHTFDNSKEDQMLTCWSYIDVAFRSYTDTVIIPLQDILYLGNEARMNTPGSIEGNWQWRCTKKSLTKEIENMLSEYTLKYRRNN